MTSAAMLYSDDDESNLPIGGSTISSIPPPNSRRTDAKKDDEELITIRVIAPATLSEGYTFDVMVDDEPYTVEVPPGGVKEGQEFEILYEPHIYGKGGRLSSSRRYSDPQDEDEDETRSPLKANDEDEDSTRIQERGTMPIRSMSEDNNDDEDKKKKGQADSTWYDEVTGAPIGRWRNTLCSCCDVVTQSTFWMGLCCAPVLIAQLITRLGLTWNGRLSATEEEKSLSFNRIIIATMMALAIWKVPLVGDLILLLFYLLVVVLIGAQVRKHMRQKYKIPPSLPTRCGQRLDDGCCMLFCGCCSAIQMARHTHDDKEYPGHGCTTTGLGLAAPMIV